MLQAMSFFKDAIMGMVIGITLKLVLQAPFLAIFSTSGALLATGAAFIGIAIFYLWRLRVRINLSVVEVLNQIKGITLLSSAMGIATWLVNHFLRRTILSPEISIVHQVAQIVIVAGVGVAVYVIGGLRFKLLDTLLGDKAKMLRAKLGMGRYDK